MKFNNKYFLPFIGLILMVSSCRPDPPPPDEPTTGILKINFDNVVGTQDLILNTGSYLNENNDTFNVTTFKYYISNVKLYTASGSHYDIPNSYYLVDESSPGSTTVSIDNIPNNTYTAIEFILGVDSTRNVSGVQSGALDPGNNMFWSWSSGYIMLKMEGTSPVSPATQNALLFHVGGFSGTENVLKTFTPNLNGNTLNINSTSATTLYLKTDLLEMFKTPTTIDFSTFYGVHMPGVGAITISDNYSDMISFDHIN